MAKHRQLIPIKTGTDSYNVNCVKAILNKLLEENSNV